MLRSTPEVDCLVIERVCDMAEYLAVQCYWLHGWLGALQHMACLVLGHGPHGRSRYLEGHLQVRLGQCNVTLTLSGSAKIH